MAQNISDMKLEKLELKQLNPAAYNPRVMTEEEFKGLQKSLEQFGQRENLIVNKRTGYTLVSGHQRYEAMKRLGWTEAYCDVIDVDEHTEKKLNVIMNSQAISGKYDELKLAELLEELKLDDDYTDLRLGILEPLDLSGVEMDESQISSEDDYLNRGIKQIVLAYSLDEFTDLMGKVNQLVDKGGLGANPSELFKNLVEAACEDHIQEA